MTRRSIDRKLAISGSVWIVLFAMVLLGGWQAQNFNYGLLTNTQSWTGTNTFTQQIVSTLTTGTAPLSIASTTTVPNLTLSNHPKIQFCGTTVACSATALTSGQVVFGTAALSSGTPSTAVITGISPAFTSATSYKCFPNDVTTITNAVNVVTYTSGSSFTINGPTTVTDTVAYICVGN